MTAKRIAHKRWERRGMRVCVSVWRFVNVHDKWNHLTYSAVRRNTRRRWYVIVNGERMATMVTTKLCRNVFIIFYWNIFFALSWWKEAEPLSSGIKSNNKSLANDMKKMKTKFCTFAQFDIKINFNIACQHHDRSQCALFPVPLPIRLCSVFTCFHQNLFIILLLFSSNSVQNKRKKREESQNSCW